MKKKVIAIAAVILMLAAGGFAFILFNAETAASDAVNAYNAAAEEYNTAIAPYNEAASGISEANNTLQGVLDEAQAVLDEGKKAYEPDTQDQLESAVQQAKKVFAEVPVQIDPLEIKEAPGSFNKAELELAQHEAETALKAAGEALEKVPDVPEVPDYEKELDAVRTAQKKYTDSVQKLANVTAPADSFVKERLEKLETVTAAEAVTEKNDPNGLLGKEGGYVGCVYFLDERVDRSLLPQEAFVKEKNAAGADAAAAAQETGNTEAVETTAEKDTGEAAAQETGSADAANNTAEKDAGEAAAETADAKDPAAAAAEKASSDKTGEAAAEQASGDKTGEAAADTASADKTAASSEEKSTAAVAGETNAAAAADETAAGAGTEAKKESGIDVVMIGTAGGGAVEVYATEEAAAKRAEYIAFFDGSVMAAGPCQVEGTCVIRASKHLSAEDQQKLIKAVRDALLAVDE